MVSSTSKMPNFLEMLIFTVDEWIKLQKKVVD